MLCGLPNDQERAEILAAHARSISVDPSVALAQLADRTVGWTSADLAGLVASANLRAVQRCLDERVAAAKARAEKKQQEAAAAAGGSGSSASGIAWAEGGSARSIKHTSADEAHLVEWATRVGSWIAAPRRVRMSSSTVPNCAANAHGATHDDALSDATPVVTPEDFEYALQTTRCSLSDKERRRLETIYAAFSGTGDAKASAKQGSKLSHK